MTDLDTDEPLVLRSDCDSVTTLTLNRPEARNPLSLGMLTALGTHLDALAVDPSVRVVVITAEGPAFSAGHDLRELNENKDRTFHEEVFGTCSRLMQQVAQLDKPVVAKVAGVATAAGCQLVASCDLTVASTSARFATPGVNIGLFCSTPAVAVSRVLSPKHAMELLLTGEMIGAEDAQRMGLVNRVVPDEDLDDAVSGLTRLLASKPPAVIAAGKRAFREQVGLPLAEAYGVATASMVDALGQVEATEGINAFLEKREPQWPDSTRS